MTQFQNLRIIYLLVAILSVFPAYAIEKPVTKIALVIGNDNYDISPLNNAVNDATDMGHILQEIGFKVFFYKDIGKMSMHQAIEDFYSSLTADPQSKIMAVFYYAGHAVQINHRNYLVPVDFTGTEKKLLNTLLDINLLFENIPSKADISNIVILDACRNNPFNDTEILSGDGLAPMRAPASTLIAYSTEPGNVAKDGEGSNGIYTKHLLRQIKEEIPIEEVFRKVRKSVAKDTKNGQIPWEHSSLVEEIFFNAPVNRDMPELMSF